MPEILFNKTENGISELRAYLPNLFASAEWDLLKEYVVDATEMLVLEIGNPVYALALAHYKSDNHGSTSSPEHIRLNELVKYCQKPVSLFTYLEYAPANDIKDDGNGRRMHVDDNSKLPFEWALQRQELKIFHRAHRSMDNLINFLDKEKGNIAEWAASDFYKDRQSLIVRSAKELSNVFPIENSSWLYQKTLPFNKESQRTRVQDLMTPAEFTAFMTAFNGDDPLSSDNAALLLHIRNIIGYHTMARAYRMLPLNILPQGITAGFLSDQAGSSSASQVADKFDRLSVAQELERQAAMESARLEEKLKRARLLAQDKPYPKEKEKINCITQKHFRV